MTDHVTRRGLLVGGAAVAAAGLVVNPREAWADWRPPPDEDGYALWLRYPRVDDSSLLHAYRRALTHVVAPGDHPVLRSAAAELTKGLSGLLDRRIAERPEPRGDGAVIVGTRRSSRWIARHVGAAELEKLGPEGYVLRRRRVDGGDAVLVASASERGALYGAFHLLRLLQTHHGLGGLDVREHPALPIRIANHWDNLDRTVERGYAGLSVFHWDELPEVLPHYTDYARILASVGMNGTVVNNVNANSQFLADTMIRDLRGLAGVLRAWGVTFYLSANYASPMLLDGLDTADPLDGEVRAWWRRKADTIYAAIPDFGGFLVTANSEGQPGPLDYGRTHADGANMLAEAVEPHGGIVMWRAFIHDFDPDTWAHKSYETFEPLDGEFADNVVLQMKNGPIDFQVREPVHPLFGALPKTNSMLELQVTQEYTGQTTHLCYLVPQWKQVYGFDTHAKGRGPTVADVVDGTAYDYTHCGVAGVMNFGDDGNDWTLHQLAAANNHGYARLAWNPALEADDIAEEWVRMTYGSHPATVSTVKRILLSSWETYEDYTSPLGCGFMSSGNNHLDPDPVVSHGFHRTDEDGTGFDRTMATGNGYTGLYHPENTRLYESLDTCPDELLLFFHHVPFSHRLRSGRNVIQHIYDTHFDGLEAAERLRRQWRSVRPRIDASRHADTLERFDRQVDHATTWRDTMVEYYFEWCRILDARRSWVQIRAADGPAAFLTGLTNRLRVTAGNATRRAVDVTARAEVPETWSSGTEDMSVPSREFAERELAVTVPTDVLTGFATVHVEADAGRVEVLTGARADVSVVIAPTGHQCVLALDAGSTSSPVMPTYTRLTPDDAWDPDKGYGWVGDKPQTRDRGTSYDALRRDFCNDAAARTLRVAIPAGRYDTYLLTGDQHSSYPMSVRSEGKVLAESEFKFGGTFAWLSFTLDGGASGREIDLELSGEDTQHWHLNALVVIDPEGEVPQAVLGEARAPAPMFGGRANDVVVPVTNTTDAALAVTVSADVPDGWTSGEATASVPSGETSEVTVAVTPPAAEPTVATIGIEVRTGGQEVVDRRDERVDVVPSGDEVALALDAGSADSPLLDTYTRLAPGDAWDAQRGYGWVGTAPQSRDRGDTLDPLRRDFVNNAAAGVLRLAVPAGDHEVHVLVGDSVASGPTHIRSGGTLLAETGAQPDGSFTWLRFDLAGGTEHDLELTGDAGAHWHLNALVIRSR